jgi:ABC-type transport system substrate-binding protein
VISQPAEATTTDPGRSAQVLTVTYFITHDLMEQARYAMDPKVRKELHAEAIKLRDEEKPSLDLFQELVVYGTSKRVAFEPRPDYRLIVAEMALGK